MPLVAFVTAYDEYAIKAFEMNAVDYLLKPIDRTRLAETLQRAQDRLEQADLHREDIAHIQNAATAYEASSRKVYLERIPVRQQDEVILFQSGTSLQWKPTAKFSTSPRSAKKYFHHLPPERPGGAPRPQPIRTPFPRGARPPRTDHPSHDHARRHLRCNLEERPTTSRQPDPVADTPRTTTPAVGFGQWCLELR